MLVWPVTYTDLNDTERTENFYFNLTEAEIAEMELSVEGGMTEMMKRMSETQDIPAIAKIVKELVLKAYGVKSADGRYFDKEDENGRPLARRFERCPAYSVLYMELATDADKAAKFFNGLMPKKKANPVPFPGNN